MIKAPKNNVGKIKCAVGTAQERSQTASYLITLIARELNNIVSGVRPQCFGKIS